MKKNKGIVFLIFLLACMSIISCSGKKNTENESSSSDDLAKYMTIAQQEIEKYYTDLSYSYKTEDWTIYSDKENGTISIISKATRKSDNESKVLNVIVTLSDSEDKYTSHFVEFGGEVLFDDGTIE